MLNRILPKLLDRLAPKEGLVLLVMAVLVGGSTGLAAVFFIRLIAYIHHLSFSSLAGLLPELGRFWFVIIPVLGGLAGGPIIAYFAQEAKGHGVPEVMQAMVLNGGRIRPRVAAAKIVASALCIGTGGSAGREGPIVQVGSTLASTLGQWLNLSDERIKNLVACGAAAGIAATFNAPIAGITFALEVLLAELQVAAFGNVVIASVSASIVSRLMLGIRPAFTVPAYALHSSWEILLYALLGFLAALVGVYFIRMLDAFENYFDRMSAPKGVKPAIGALLLGMLAYFYPHISSLVSIFPETSRLGWPQIDTIPHIYGSGFDFLDHVLKGEEPFFLLFLLIFLKPLATCFTLGSGNSGGVFAPSLFTGAMLGGAFGYLAKYLAPSIPIEIGAYSLVGMAAVFAAAARAPLTAMLIVFEMSNDYQLILPLMAAGMIASYVAQVLQPDSIYTIKLSKRGIRFEQGRDLDILQGVNVEEVMNHAPVTIHREQSVADLFALFQSTHLQGFPVMTGDEDLYGVITMQDMERELQRMEARQKKGETPRALKDITVGEVATRDPLTVYPDEPVWAAIRKMAPRDLARLPVVARHGEHKLIGQISRSDILRAYQMGLMRKQQRRFAMDRLALRPEGGVAFVEVTVSPESRAADRKVAELPFHQSTAIVSIKRGEEQLIPNSGTIFRAGDLVTVFCRSVHRADIRRLFESPEEASCAAPGGEQSEKGSQQ